MIYSRFLKGLLASSLLLLSVSSHAAMVSFDQSSYSMKQGNVFTVSIFGSFSAQEILDGGGLSLNFNSTVLKVNSVTINTTLFEFYSDPGTINNISGNVSDMIFNTFTYNATGNFKIADINLTALKSGNSDFLLTESLLNPFSSAVAGVGGLTVNYTNALVNVSAVPLPGALLLMLSSFMFMAPLLKRKKINSI